MENNNLKSDFFDTRATDLLGNIIIDKTVSSNEFIREGAHILTSLLNSVHYGRALYDYANIIKELVKQEMLTEMRKRIDHINTFYN